MKIAFVVNTTGLTGGIKVILTHANNLQAMGHEVAVIHLLKLADKPILTILACLKKIKYFLLRLTGRNGIDWFVLKPQIEIFRLSSLAKIKSYDCLIATANETADAVCELPVGKGTKFYFVQDYENWTRAISLVDRTYRLPLKKIVISSRLRSIIEEKFAQPAYGPVMNGVELSDFSCSKEKEKKPLNVLMPYHILPKKGTEIGLEVLARLKKEYPEATITLFGAYKVKQRIDFDHRFVYRPTGDALRDVYCTADIFINPCLEEGFGLTPMEAMASKCAVVTTDVGAISEYAINDETALIVKPGDKEELYFAVKQLVENEILRKKISERGYESMKNHTWQKASRQLEQILLANVKID